MDYKNSRFSAEISSFTPQLNTGKHNVNVVNTYETILVAFYNPFKVARDSKFGPYAGRGQFQYLIVNKKLMCQHAVTFSVQKCSR